MREIKRFDRAILTETHRQIASFHETLLSQSNARIPDKHPDSSEREGTEL